MNLLLKFGSMAILRAAAVSIALLGLSGAAAAQDLERGRALYEHHCQACHEDWAHTRAGRKVDTLGELRARVASWSTHAGLDWTRDEVDDVTNYLNVAFYQLVK